MNKLKLTALLVTVCALFTGCFGGAEINKRSFVELMGIEKRDDLYVVSIQLYQPQNEGGEPDTSKPNAKMVSGEGISLYSAVENAEIKQGKEFFLGHIKLLIIGDNIENPAEELSLFFDEGVSIGCPVVYSKSPSEIVSLKMSEGLYSAEYLLELMDSSARRGRTVYAPVMRLAADNRILNLPSALPVLTTDGETALFKGLTFAANATGISGSISEDDVAGVKLLMDDYTKKDKLTIPVSVNGKTASAALVNAKTRKTADIPNDNILRLDVEIDVLLQIAENPYHLDNGQIEAAVRENLRDAVLSAYSTAIWYNKRDVIGIYKNLRKYNPELLDVYMSDPDGYLEDSILNIKIDSRIK